MPPSPSSPPSSPSQRHLADELAPAPRAQNAPSHGASATTPSTFTASRAGSRRARCARSTSGCLAADALRPVLYGDRSNELSDQIHLPAQPAVGAAAVRPLGAGSLDSVTVTIAHDVLSHPLLYFFRAAHPAWLAYACALTITRPRPTLVARSAGRDIAPMSCHGKSIVCACYTRAAGHRPLLPRYRYRIRTNGSIPPSPFLAGSNPVPLKLSLPTTPSPCARRF